MPQEDQPRSTLASLTEQNPAAAGPENYRKRRQRNTDAPKKRRRSDGEQKEKTPAEEELSQSKSTKRESSRNTVPSARPSARVEISNQPTRPGHVRFGSEDPPDIIEEQNQLLDKNAIDEEENGHNSDEDAPEDIATAAAEATTRATKAQATRAIESQQRNTKKKRREREARLQQQATKAASSRKRLKASELPDLLPEDVLAEDTFDRAPTPPLAIKVEEEAKPLSKAKKIKFEDNGPDDVQVGPVKVSVLNKSNGLLAPKANSRSYSIKQQWLSGRSGRQLSRQSIGGNFIRS